MDSENMERLVEYLAKYIKTGDYLYHPCNTHHSWYLNIFLDEHKNGKRQHLDQFSDVLSRKLIVDENIKELDVSDSAYTSSTEQQKKYDTFYNTWNAWSDLHDALRKNDMLK